jgi:uncharacterized Zn-finger protein
MKYTCEKCGKEYARKNNLEMHEKYCKGVEEKKNITRKLPVNDKIKKISKNVECPKSKTGFHDLVILKNINPIQHKALLDGYTAYCRICEELI